MPSGDKLFSLREPNSVEVQVRNLQRDVRSVKNKARTATSSPGVGSLSPPVNPEDIGLTSSLDYSPDGTYRPAITVTIPSDYQATRGFIGYDALLYSPHGETTLTECRIDSTGALPTFKLKGAVTPATSSTPEQWFVSVRTVSGVYGPSEWSEKVSVNVSAASGTPPAPTGVTSTPIPNGAKVAWDQVDVTHFPDYSHSEVFLSLDSTVDKTDDLAGSTSANSIQIVVNQIVGYTYLGVCHIATDGRASAFTAIPISNSTNFQGIPNTQLMPITAPGLLTPQLIASSPMDIYDGSTPAELRAQIYWSDAGKVLVLFALDDPDDPSDHGGVEIHNSFGDIMRMNNLGGIAFTITPGNLFEIFGSATISGDLSVAGDFQMHYATLAKWGVG